MSLLQNFANAVAKRVPQAARFGTIEDLIVVLLPVIVELIGKCFDTPADLRSFAEGKRSALQLVGLRIRCNQAARETGLKGALRVSRAGAALADAVLAELSDQSQSAAATGPTDIYTTAFEEAAAVT